MDDIAQSVMNGVKTGEYFKDAQDWYKKRYLYPFTERSLLFVICIITFILMVLSGATIYFALPLREEVPFSIAVEDMVNKFTKIQSLTSYEDHPDQALASYLVSHYVKMRESFSLRDVEKQLLRVRQNSSRQVYKEFESSFFSNQAIGKSYESKKYFIRTVLVHEILLTLAEQASSANMATILFDVVEENRQTKEKQKSRWRADVRFSLPTIAHMIQSGTKNILFVVTDYKLSEMKK
jgi:type IV secretory pathway component VirB8